MNIALAIGAVISAITAFISALIARKSAKASERSAEAAVKSYQLETKMTRITLRVEPTINPVTHDTRFDANIKFTFKNVGKEEGTLLRLDLMSINLETKEITISPGKKTQFPLAPGQTFNCKITINNIPQGVLIPGFALILIVQLQGKYIQPKEIRTQRYDYIYGGKDLSILPDENYKEIDEHLQTPFKRTKE